MRLFEAIKSQSDELLHTASRLEDSNAGEPEIRQRLLEELSSSLDEHRQIDEDLIYPVFLAAEERSPLIERSREECSAVQQAIEALRKQPQDSGDAKFGIETLTSLVRDYVSHENHELLARADQLLPDDEEKSLAATASARHPKLGRRMQHH